MSALLREVESGLFSLRKGKITGAKLQDHYNSSLKKIGLSVPEMRSFSERRFSISELKIDKQWKEWELVWKSSDYVEVMSIPLYWLERQKIDFVYKKKAAFFRWIKQVENWAHSDSYSSILVRLLENYPNEVYPQLVKWNSSKNLWERRQSVVGLLYYAGGRKKTLALSKMYPLVNNLLDDPEYYVQKGVGWTLRELGHLNQDRQLKFIESNLSRLSSVAFSSATEKTDKKIKEKFKAKRKIIRKSK